MSNFDSFTCISFWCWCWLWFFRWRRWRWESSINATSTLLFNPTFNVILPISPKVPSTTQSSNHSCNDTSYCYHCYDHHQCLNWPMWITVWFHHFWWCLYKGLHFTPHLEQNDSAQHNPEEWRWIWTLDWPSWKGWAIMAYDNMIYCKLRNKRKKWGKWDCTKLDSDFRI